MQRVDKVRNAGQHSRDSDGQEEGQHQQTLEPTFPRWILFRSPVQTVDSMISSNGVSFHDCASFSPGSTHFWWPEIPRNGFAQIRCRRPQITSS
jgi:hypothetical protein